jgi:arylsulfatase A-like enzyme
MFVGYADDRIVSNAKVPNPNIHVLEHLHRQPAFAGKVAAFCTWDVFDFILNRDRSGIPVQCGWTLIADEPLTAGQRLVNDMVRELPRLWRGNTYDMVTHRAAREYVIKHQPRLLYLGLGETDEWAHARRYDLYLEAANRSDQYLRELWELLQSIPQYKDRTALLVTSDHGRGDTGRDWTNHNAETPGAEQIWIAVMGPGVPAQGIRDNVTTSQSQVAATIAYLVDVDFVKSSNQSAPPLPLLERHAQP